MARKSTKKENLETLASFVSNYHNNTPYSYVCRNFPDEQPKPHHKFLLDLVQRCTMKPTFACLSLPPGSAKSTTLMRGLAWWIANYPKDTHAYVTYGQDLSWDMSRKIRYILTETAPHIKFTTSRVEAWSVEQGGGLFATGIGGPLTGKRVSGLLIVDDPYKNLDDARSPEYRARVSEWFKTVAMTRLQKGASTIVVHCIAGDEKVAMADGTWKAIRDIAPGDEVIGYDTDTHRTTTKIVLAHKLSGHASVYEVKCGQQSTIATDEHPFLTVSAGPYTEYKWKLVRDLKVGDIIVALNPRAVIPSIGAIAEYTPVTSVSAAGTADVYDITVDGTENFFPGGLCAHNTRWHQSDLIAELTKDHGYLYKNFPAINEDGTLLWPEQYDHELLQQRRSLIGEANFSALYQGKPVADGAHVFGEPHYYDPQESKNGWMVYVAADPAATSKRTADFSCAIALGVRGKGADMECRVFDFLHGQWTIPEFARRLERFQRTWFGCRVGVEAVNGFKAVPQMLREINPRLRILEIHPKGDKLQRAQPLAAAWNEGRVLIPKGAPWAATLVNELTAFTGAGDDHDDIVDAAAHAFNMALAANQAKTAKRGAVLDFNRYR